MGTTAAVKLDRRELIFTGRQSLIYRAVTADRQEPIVAKVLPGPYPSTHQVDRLEREHDVTARLDCPYIVKVRGFVELGESVAILLEDIGGISLADQKRSLELEEALDIAAKVAEALAHAHEHDVIHKDVNPSNVVYNRATGEVQLIDFGIATTLSREQPASPHATELQGTLAYISPEQTGRTNRTLDYRTDLYSFGATLYELLTGQLPFESGDALELLHLHLAVRPQPPREIDDRVPAVVSEIVMKLLAKNAEDRYQSARGVWIDLCRCRDALREHGVIDPFPIAQRDLPSRLEVPQKLYGRRRESAQLEAAFDSAAQGSFELVAISGEPGIGKSALARALLPRVTERRGTFLVGKFEQYQRDRPYKALVTALRHFVRQALAESSDRLDHIKARLVEAMGHTGQAVLDIAPELEHLVGPQPPLADLPAAESERRFHGAMQRLVNALSSAEAPLVLFLDDLQWADASSLRLLERLATDPDAQHLLVVGAYRDNEVERSHPAMLCLEAIARSGVPISYLHLQTLGRASVRELLSDTVGRRDDAVTELTNVCLDKTAGNPFFLRQFLQGLAESSLLAVDGARRQWDWDLDAVREAALTENVVDFLTARAQTLPSTARDLLRLAAIMGDSFELEALQRFSGEAERDWASAATECVRVGLVIPLASADDDAMLSRLAFTHDRVLQAGYALTPDDERRELHLRLGRQLLQRLDGDDDEGIFAALGHLNRCSTLVDDPNERMRIAELDVVAGERALRSASAQEALSLFEHALQWAGPQLWTKARRFALRLHEGAIEAAFLCTDVARLRELADVVLAKGRDPLETVRVKQLLIAQHKRDRDSSSAVTASLELLAELGVELPKRTSDLFVLRELGRTKLLLRNHTMADLEALPEASDPVLKAALDVLGDLIPASYYAKPELLPFVAFELVRRSVRHGVTPMSAYGFSVYGLLLCTLGQIDAGYDMGAMATRLAARLGDPRLTNMARHVFHTHMRFWKDHLRHCMQVEREVHLSALEAGDHEYAAFGAMMHCNMSTFVGDPLMDVLDRQRVYGEAIRRLQQETSWSQHAVCMQLVLNLIEPEGGRHRLGGPAYDEAEMQRQHEEADDATMLFVHHAAKVVACVLFREYGEGLEHVAALGRYKKAAASSMWTWIAEVYSALCETGALTEASLPRRAAGLMGLARRRLSIAKWAKAGPDNYTHLLALVDAEIARLRGREAEAMRAYSEAIEGARDQGYTNVEALACELAARFYLDLGQQVAGRAHLARARYAYGRWGAAAKLAALDEEFATTISMAESASPPSTTRPLHTTLAGATLNGTFSASDAQIDMLAVMRAARAISEPIVLSELLERLMQTVVESAGAQRGVLVVVDEGEGRIEAFAEEGGLVDTSTFEALDATTRASKTIISYALRMGESVVVEDAQLSPEYSRDAYLRDNGVRSVLCTPIVQHGEAVAAVYLENNLAPQAFTSQRTEVVSMLVSQAAVSIQNARLYAVLDDKVKQRTAELEIRNRFIKETFGRYLTDAIVDRLLQSPEALALGGEKRVVTVLMADLRGFIATSEGLAPERVVQLINNFLSAMTEVIVSHDGTIDEFIGDAILVIFGAPVVADDDAQRAVECALAMQREMEKVNATNRELGLPEVAMGIGISTGEVVVGNIGSERRAKYGVVGSTVNLASRIESFTRGGDILIPQSTRASLDDEIIADRTFSVTVKGQRESLKLHSVIGLQGREDLRLPERGRGRTSLPEGLDVHYSVLEDNRVLPTVEPATIVALSESSALLRTNKREPAFTNLRLLIGAEDGEQHEIYAKVEPEDERDGFAVHFTSVPEPVREMLRRHLS